MNRLAARGIDRAACMRQTDENFYLALDRPFNEQDLKDGQNLRRLQNMGQCTAHILDEGSLVFVYPREIFDPTKVMEDAEKWGFTDAHLFRERAILELRAMTGRTAIDAKIEEVKDKVTPNPAMSFK
jgi:hypothetical protein